ncbi:Ribonuclease P [Lentibacillus sp. JNUCC-1]|uniref:ribonuclease P protein component n=1 Tax=Lentibacillus sp. JNUCC-1 TaxID=2654513 RepID=UPI0012E7352C|nr:ribonuclease P protein component [Lentibacillus sp. JNUCC-1]MUV37946.1 Ribonuclease P [Lentibacillus sp. JNUCC-1]
MKKQFRIKKNKEFQAVFNKGRTFANRQLVIYYRENPDQSYFRVGLSVGKKIGNAVTRNRIKRYLREAFQALSPGISGGYDIVIIARKPTKDLGAEEIKRSLHHLLAKQGLFRKK